MSNTTELTNWAAGWPVIKGQLEQDVIWASDKGLVYARSASITIDELTMALESVIKLCQLVDDAVQSFQSRLAEQSDIRTPAKRSPRSSSLKPKPPKLWTPAMRYPRSSSLKPKSPKPGSKRKGGQ